VQHDQLNLHEQTLHTINAVRALLVMRHMCAQASVERTVARMAALGLCPAAQHGVFFGQLLGMADHLTFTLGRSGYRVRHHEHISRRLD